MASPDKLFQFKHCTIIRLMNEGQATIYHISIQALYDYKSLNPYMAIY